MRAAAECAAECDTHPTCAGFAWETSGGNQCIIYGPGLAGSCAAPNQAVTSESACLAVGAARGARRAWCRCLMPRAGPCCAS